ncbi:hypothetical protein E2C01_021319 [Portunus trituberculatus]|uniref:Secreted protein n=1 Tax=Portunus trituberculatus TaxID=210409 RepID=A0A5B7E5R5_PORTR|nr:hypothetical protein [Portunus trituberculatus]
MVRGRLLVLFRCGPLPALTLIPEGEGVDELRRCKGWKSVVVCLSTVKSRSMRRSCLKSSVLVWQVA